MCNAPALFIVGRDRGKLSYFWRHALPTAKSGRYQGSVTNPDSGAPVYSSDQTERLLRTDFKKAKLSEIIGGRNGDAPNNSRRSVYSALWQAGETRIRRFCSVQFFRPYIASFFHYATAGGGHYVHGDTGPGQAPGTPDSCT